MFSLWFCYFTVKTRLTNGHQTVQVPTLTTTFTKTTKTTTKATTIATPTHHTPPQQHRHLHLQVLTATVPPLMTAVRMKVLRTYVTHLCRELFHIHCFIVQVPLHVLLQQVCLKIHINLETRKVSNLGERMIHHFQEVQSLIPAEGLRNQKLLEEQDALVDLTNYRPLAQLLYPH